VPDVVQAELDYAIADGQLPHALAGTDKISGF
jgi:hypothetical protein